VSTILEREGVWENDRRLGTTRGKKINESINGRREHCCSYNKLGMLKGR
jgi:hypothetical protein